MTENSILADIQYNPYVILIVHMDCERFFRTGKGVAAFSEASNIFTRECEKYHRGLRRNLRDYAPYAGYPAKAAEALDFEPFLFNPACFVGFGDTDNIAFVAMDDFDLAMHLVSKPNLPIRQTCLAFSPTIESLGLETDDDIFYEIKDICSTPIDHGIDLQAVKAPRHEYLRSRPLVAVTYFKFNGMAVLGPGLLMQEAALRAITKEVKAAIDEIKNLAAGDSPQDLELTKAAESFCCVLLDPQGWADLASIMLCRDYSVIATVLAKIRCLTHQHLYAEWDRLPGRKPKDFIECFGLHSKMAQAFKLSAKKFWHQDWSPKELLEDNHVFCSTFSTLGISHEAFEKTETDKRPSNYSGDVIADTRFVCSAGHCTKLKEIASNTRYRAQPKKKLGHIWYLIGHHDFIYQQMLDDTYYSNIAVELSDLIQEIKGMRDCLQTDEELEPQLFLHLHALEMSTDMRIPLLKGVELSSPQEGHVETRLVLDRIKTWLLDEDHEKGFSIRRLQNALTEIQLPEPLSTSVNFLFLDYVTYLSDVFLFDHVVDLHDVFTAVYGLIARRLPDDMKRQVKSSYDARTFLDAADLDHIVELIDLLRSALSNRVQVAFREAERWGITLDVRGGSFNRLLNAADVPLKCGLGLLWRVAQGYTDLYNPDNPGNDIEAIKRQIGGASRLMYDSRSHSHRLDVGYNDDFFITSVDLNLIHLTRPRNLLVHLHETAHLICHFLREKVKCTHQEYPCYWYGICCHKRPMRNPRNRAESHLRDRFEDVFSEMLVLQFVFENDYNTYLRNYVASCATEWVASVNDPEEVFCQTVEMLLRGFLVTDPFRRPNIYSEENNQSITPEIIEEGFNLFSEVIRDISSFLFDYDDILRDAPKGRMKDYFTRVFQESYYPVCCIWKDVQTIYQGICEDDAVGLDPAPIDRERLITDIQTGLSCGRPLVRVLYKDPRLGRTTEESARLDALFLVRHLLKFHVTNLFANIDTKNYTCCLIRGIDGRANPEGTQEEKKLNRQLLDRVFNGLVAADPVIRGRYMLERVVIIKSLWDISTNFRARRMLDILKTVWQL